MNQELIEKVLELQFAKNEEESNMFINFICTKIKYYQDRINQLKRNKPFWFQKKKIKEYNQKLEEYEIIIQKCYQEISEEIK